MRKRALAGVLAAVAAVGLVVTGCTGSGGNTSSTGGTATEALKIGNFLDVTNWDPSLADIGFDGPYLSAVYDPLLAMDKDGNPVPALATEFTVSDDGLTIDMTLRTDATFSDGEPFDADAAVKSLEYLQDGVTSSEAYTRVESFEKTGDDSIAIHLTQRDDTILYFMALGRSYMMSPKAIDAGTLSTTPVGSGPYTMDSTSVAGSRYLFTKVEDHWDSAAFPFETVEILPIGDGTAMQNAMDSGQVNVIYADAANIATATEKGWNVAQQIATAVGLQYTDRMGETFEPLGDQRVREALQRAFDGAAILDAMGSGAGVDTNQVFAADHDGYLSSLNDMYAYDVAEAKQLLADAGYADGFSINMPMAPPFQPWQAIAEQSLKDIGVTVTWDEMQMGDYMQKSSTYPISITLIALDSNPVATVERQAALPQWYNPNPQIDQVPELQELVDQMYATQGDEQLEVIEQLNTKLTELAWFNVWYQADNVFFSTADITVQPLVGTMFPTLRQITTS
ncbi:MAG: ABC transporter substrate-binding protein [Microbacterium sp.]